MSRMGCHMLLQYRVKRPNSSYKIILCAKSFVHVVINVYPGSNSVMIAIGDKITRFVLTPNSYIMMVDIDTVIYYQDDIYNTKKEARQHYLTHDFTALYKSLI